jgi:hypothetical protein
MYFLPYDFFTLFLILTVVSFLFSIFLLSYLFFLIMFNLFSFQFTIRASSQLENSIYTKHQNYTDICTLWGRLGELKP